MLSLVKRFWVAVVVCTAAVVVLGVPTTWSYLKGGRKVIEQAVRDLTPIELDLKRLEAEIDSLVPQIRAARQVVAEMDVSIGSQQKDLAALEERQAGEKAQMQKLRDLLRSSDESFKIGGRTYTRHEVEQDLARRLDRYEQAQATLKARQAVLAQQRESFESAQRKLAELTQAKERLVAKAQGLAQQLEALRLAQKTSTVSVDTSALARAEEIAKGIEQRIQVLSKTLAMEERRTEGIAVEVDARPPAERFDALFASPGQ